MSRGPTRRVRRLIESGPASAELLSAAEREADLLGHPYVGLEHVRLARLVLEGRLEERDALRALLTPGVRRRWWRPRGPRSALRTAGLAEADAARRRAQRDEHPSIARVWALRDTADVEGEGMVSAVRAGIAAGEWETVRLLLHPYLRWTGSDGRVIRGRKRVLAMLQATQPTAVPAAVELRDGQIYRWLT